MKKIFAALLLTLMSSSVLAGGSVTSKLTGVRVDSSGNGVIYFEKEVQNRPACVNPSYVNALSFDLSTDGGKALYSMALTAETAGKAITAYGIGSCPRYGIIEAINYAHTQK